MPDCICMTPPFHGADFESRDVGVDESNGRFGQVTLETCIKCKRKWLRYSVEYEAFTGSGRWYRGLVPDEIAKSVTPEIAVKILASLDWLFVGGSYFQTAGLKSSGSVLVDL